MEKWKTLPGFNGKYLVSDRGKVKSLHNGLEYLMKLQPETTGYLTVNLSLNGTSKRMRVHRMVLLAFVGPSDLCVTHKDFNRANNAIENLEYVTHLQNNLRSRHRVKFAAGERNGMAKLSDEDRDTILSLKGTISSEKLAKRYGIHRANIRRVWNTWERVKAVRRVAGQKQRTS